MRYNEIKYIYKCFELFFAFYSMKNQLFLILIIFSLLNYSIEINRREKYQKESVCIIY